MRRRLFCFVCLFAVYANFVFFALYNHKILCYNYIKVQSKGVTLNEMYVLRL